MTALPKKLASYIHQIGVRSLDHLAESVPQPSGVAPASAVESLVASWRSMNPQEKDEFVDRVAASIGEVIAASARLPAGVKTGRKAMKTARKVLKKSARTLRKSAKAASKPEKKAAKKSKPPKAPNAKKAPKAKAPKVKRAKKAKKAKTTKAASPANTGTV